MDFRSHEQPQLHYCSLKMNLYYHVRCIILTMCLGGIVNYWQKRMTTLRLLLITLLMCCGGETSGIGEGTEVQYKTSAAIVRHDDSCR